MPEQASAATSRPAPPRYKLALLTWAGAYGVITLIIGVLGPSIQGWPLPLRTLLISVMMVLLLTWVIVPTLVSLFQPWLLRAPRAAPASDCGGRARVPAGLAARARGSSATG